MKLEDEKWNDRELEFATCIRRQMRYSLEFMLAVLKIRLLKPYLLTLKSQNVSGRHMMDSRQMKRNEK